MPFKSLWATGPSKKNVVTTEMVGYFRKLQKRFLSIAATFQETAVIVSSALLEIETYSFENLNVQWHFSLCCLNSTFPCT